jgi:hypothetical protein
LASCRTVNTTFRTSLAPRHPGPRVALSDMINCPGRRVQRGRPAETAR